MAIRKVVANEKIKTDAGKIALQRGPIMYCAEWADNHNMASNLIIPKGSELTADFEPQLLNGVTVLEGPAIAVQISDEGRKIATVPVKLRAIPYYAWANRGKGEMVVWFPEKVSYVELIAH